MPMDIRDYPADWKAVSRYVRHERAGNKCETCGVPNGWYVARDKSGNVTDYWGPEPDDRRKFDAEFDGDKVTKIVLTTAHTCGCEAGRQSTCAS